MKVNPLAQAVHEAIPEMKRPAANFYYHCKACSKMAMSEAGHDPAWNMCPHCGGSVDMCAGSAAPDWWVEPEADAVEPEPFVKSDKCKSIFGHRYRPRYDSSPAPQAVYDELNASKISVRAAAKLIDSMRTVTYICDVCSRCGDIVRPDLVEEDEQH